MSSKKEEERNEKIIRGLMKLPPNRRCINCNSLGPQYVCTNFWTFVCIACSGIHREFTHRVKSVSMAKFTKQEVEALQRGGNQGARELFLKDWDSQRMRLPNNSNPEKIREFIKSIYVDKKYAGSRTSDKPPRDTQSNKGEEEHRRASSYHSFSQSPPYDQQYEERRYGKQAGMLSRKPGSDRGHYEGKLSSFLYSPGHQGDQIYEDRFANESLGSRTSDYSVSSDPFRFSDHSPCFHDPGYGSPPSQVEGVRSQKLATLSESNQSIVKEDINRIPRAHRSASSGSFGSFDSNSISVKSANANSLIDSVLEPENASGIQQADTSAFSTSPQISIDANPTKIDLFNQEFVQSQNTFSAPALDLFADVSQLPSTIPLDEQKPPAIFLDLFADANQLPSTIPLNEQKPPAVPLSDNAGWASFDLPGFAAPPLQASQGLPPVVPPVEKDAPKGNIDLFSCMLSNSDWFSVQYPASHGHSSLVADQWPMGLNEVEESADSRNLQFWNAFPNHTGNVPQTLAGILPQNSESHDLHRLPTPVDPYVGFKAPEITFNDGFCGPAIDDKAPAVAHLTGMSWMVQSPPSTIPHTGGTTLERKASNPFDILYDLDSEANNLFMNMSSLQAALPEPQLPATFQGSGLTEPWFAQNSAKNFIPPVPQGGLAYIGGQVPSAQLQNIPSQGPVASLGGNPFA